jgi:hypothetical protein
MSITGLIAGNLIIRRKLPFGKSDLVDEAGYPLSWGWWEQPIQVEPIGSGREASWIGTAFDYVAMAMLERKVGSEHTLRDTWAAEGALYIICADIGGLIGEHAVLRPASNPFDATSERGKGYDLALKYHTEVRKILERYWDTAVSTHKKFLSDKASVADYAESALFLASLDAYRQATSPTVLDWAFKDMNIVGQPKGKLFFNQNVAVDNLGNAVSDIVQQCQLFERWLEVNTIDRVVLHPTYGGEVDFIYDKTLVDLKTTKKLEWSADYWAQVRRYAAVALDSGQPIERIAIYYARFGATAVLEITPERKDQLAEWLKLIQIEALRCRHRDQTEALRE